MLIIIIWYDISWEKEKVETALPLKSLHSMSLNVWKFKNHKNLNNNKNTNSYTEA